MGLRVSRILLVAFVVGLALGYLFFQSIFPSVAWPPGDRIGPLGIVAIVVVLSFLAGMVAEDMETVAILAPLAPTLGVIIAYATYISPVASEDVVGAELGEFAATILRQSIPLVLLSIVLIFIGGLLGSAFRDRLVARSARRAP